MPDIVYEILDLIASLIRFLGMGVLGVALGWLSLDLLKKAVNWQLQIAVFLGFLGLVIAMAYYLPWGTLGAFAIGAGVAILLWGMPKKKKEEEE
jgi:NhaP-type Na+/H+ or K+/H+ antiporter